MQDKAERTFRRIWMIILCIAVILSLPFLFRKSPEDQIVTLVSNNLGFLNECVEKENYEQAYKLKLVQKITPNPHRDNGLYIDFFCDFFGYYGFYYVSDDKPTGFQGRDLPLEPIGGGWLFKEEHGDNSYSTRKIADHWYYYKMAF